MLTRLISFLAIASFFLNGGACSLFAQENISLHGSTTVNDLILQGNIKDLERKLDIKLTVVASGSGKGLEDLAKGTCDVAMISSELKSIAQAINKQKVGLVNPSDYQSFSLGEASAIFIVNDSNPVNNLSEAQLRGIAQGDILNWSKVGGTKNRILFFALQQGEGVRSTIKKELLKGGFFGVYTTILRSHESLIRTVALLPDAIGITSQSFIKDRTGIKVIESDFDATQDLFLVTRGEPTGLQLKLIKTIQKISKQVNSDD